MSNTIGVHAAVLPPVTYKTAEFTGKLDDSKGAPWAEEAGLALAEAFEIWYSRQDLTPTGKVRIHSLARGDYRPGMAGGTLDVDGTLTPFGVFGTGSERVAAILTPVMAGEQIPAWA